MCLWGYVLVDLYGCMSVFCVGLCRRKSACMCFCVHTCVLHVQAWFGVYLVVCVSIPRQSVCGELCVCVQLRWVTGELIARRTWIGVRICEGVSRYVHICM